MITHFALKFFEKKAIYLFSKFFPENTHILSFHMYIHSLKKMSKKNQVKKSIMMQNEEFAIGDIKNYVCQFLKK